MQMIINGAPVEVEAANSVSELLVALGYAGKRIAVEINGEIVPKSTHAQTVIQPTDKIEIVVAVGGG